MPSDIISTPPKAFNAHPSRRSPMRSEAGCTRYEPEMKESFASSSNKSSCGPHTNRSEISDGYSGLTSEKRFSSSPLPSPFLNGITSPDFSFLPSKPPIPHFKFVDRLPMTGGRSKPPETERYVRQPLLQYHNIDNRPTRLQAYDKCRPVCH